MSRVPTEQSQTSGAAGEHVAPSGLARRSALKGAGIAAGALWLAPVVQVVSMSSASAASAAPEHVGGSTAAPAATSTGGHSSQDELAQTGGAGDALAGVGLGAVALGAGAIAASRLRRPADPEPRTD